MGYRIDYQPVASPRRTAKRRRLLLLLSVCFLAVLLLNTVLKDQRAMLLKILFPGDPAVTIASLDNMLARLKAGATLQDALVVFCQQVIAG